MRIGINEAAPAVAVKWLPPAFRLRQAIGDRVDDGRMVAHAAMAAFDLDAFGSRGGLFHAALPGADPVGAAEDRGRRHWRWFRQRAAETMIFFACRTAAHRLIDTPGVGRPRITAEWAAKRNHHTHALRHHLGELARIYAAEAPADQADLASMRVAKFAHSVDHCLSNTTPWTEIASLSPAAHDVALALQETAQRPGRVIGRDQSRKHQHRMPVAARRQAQ